MLTLVLLLTVLLPVTANAREMLGDVNHDGHVNISDVTTLISYLLNGDAGASGITNGLCRPLFGIFYPHLSMFAGLLVWMFEIIWVVPRSNSSLKQIASGIFH